MSAEEEEATLALYRSQAQNGNDNWQFSCFEDAYGVSDEVSGGVY